MTASGVKRETVKVEDIQEVLRGIARKLDETLKSVSNPITTPEPATQNPATSLPRDFSLTLGIRGTARKSDSPASKGLSNSLGIRGTARKSDTPTSRSMFSTFGTRRTIRTSRG